MNQPILFRNLTAIAALSLISVPTFAETPSEDAPVSESPARADDDPPPAPKMHLSVASPGAPVQRTDYLHEGFYLRFGVGPGFLTTNVNDKVADTRTSSTDFSLGSELLIGGSPSPGMTFGGGVLGNLGLGADPTFSFLAGPFVDAFPNELGGWHLGTMLGFAGTAVESETLFGGGASFFAGHDIWVAPEWSAGFNLRATGAQVFAADATATNFSLHFLITILHH